MKGRMGDEDKQRDNESDRINEGDSRGGMYSVVAVFVNKANVNRGSTDIWFMFKVELWFWVRLPSF